MNNNKIKVRYNVETGLVDGYFPENINYSNAPEFQEMIKEGNFIEITKAEQDTSQQMAVKDGVYQPYIHIPTLEEVRTEKLKDLERFYSSSELWTFTVKDNEGNSLTREQNWFLPRITRNIFLISNEGSEVVKIIDDPESVREKLNNIGTVIFKKKREVFTKIQNAKTITALEKIDIQKEFEVINKEIIVE